MAGSRVPGSPPPEPAEPSEGVPVESGDLAFPYRLMPPAAPVPAEAPRVPTRKFRLRPFAALATVTALVAAAVSFGGNAYAATLLSDNFEDGNSTGWTSSGGSWSVGPDGSQVLRQTGTSSDARARTGAATWTDYAVTTRVRPTAVNGTNRFVAVLARAQSNTSYYYLALRTNNTVELKKLVNGSASTLATASVSVSVGTWYTLRLEVSGSTLRGSVNGGANVTATDTQYSAGGVGVATFNAAASFDDVIVETSTGPTTPPTASPTVSPTVSRRCRPPPHPRPRRRPYRRCRTRPTDSPR